MNSEIQKQVVLITGASTGIGRLMAITFARQGFRVYATFREPWKRNIQHTNNLKNIANNEKLQLFIKELDVTNYQQAQTVVDEIIALEQRIDILINNAGIIIFTPMEMATPHLWQLQLETNVIAPMNLASLVQPYMRKQKNGLIIQMSSRVGRTVIPGIGLYCMSKSTLEAATEAAYYESTSQHVDFAIIQASAFSTDFNSNARKIFQESTLPQLKKVRPLGIEFHNDFLKKLDHDFSGKPDSDPQIVADLALKIALTPSKDRVLRYTVGDRKELEAIEEINALHARNQEQTLQECGYNALYRK